jgi:hypothetical protein
VTLETLARQFGLTPTQIARIVRARPDRRRSAAALAFSEWLTLQDAAFARFIRLTCFHGAYPTIAQTERRPFLFAGLPVWTGADAYHSWLSTNDHAALIERLPSAASAAAREHADGGTPSTLGTAWAIPGVDGLLPMGLRAVLDGTVAQLPLGVVPRATAAVDVGEAQPNR